jgi:hypothetical protein
MWRQVFGSWFLLGFFVAALAGASLLLSPGHVVNSVIAATAQPDQNASHARSEHRC